MKPTHIVQIVLACIVAGGGAAVPLLVSPMTPTAWLLLAVAEAAAIGKVLSVQSEVAGDKAPPPDAVTKAAAKIAPLAMLCLCVGALVFGTGANCQLPDISAQDQQEIVASTELALCVETVIATDGAKSPPATVEQVLLDEGVTCGPDAGNVINDAGKRDTTDARATLIASVHKTVSAKLASKKGG